ncbi:hypothetical protein MUK42_17384 [Musa troglodytarum]|uniref:Uncharacterized protein n=1 Tax=Musa troglodytarum TaxID=320322 RepID=A0A9E7IBP4_9LILI|nr:hypothetical protein MUK42_17384 [Musa troglodytarum]
MYRPAFGREPDAIDATCFGFCFPCFFCYHFMCKASVEAPSQVKRGKRLGSVSPSWDLTILLRVSLAA